MASESTDCENLKASWPLQRPLERLFDSDDDLESSDSEGSVDWEALRPGRFRPAGKAAAKAAPRGDPV